MESECAIRGTRWCFFDLYGTLIDIRTDEQSEAAWQALYDCVTELGAQYESVDVMRDQFEKLEAREMVHQADRAIVRNGWDEFDILPVYRSLLMNRSEEAEKKLALPQAALKAHGRSAKAAPACSGCTPARST